MAIRDSQDISLPIAQNVGTPRASQDLTLPITKNVGTPRASQEVILVLSPSVVRDEDFWANPTRPLAASLFQKLPYGLLGDQEEIPSGSLLHFHGPDEDFWANPVRPVKASFLPLYLFDLQDIGPAPIPLSPDEDFWRNSVLPVPARNLWPQPFSFEEHESAPVFIPPSRADKPSRQFHPLVKPLDFYSRPLTQPGKRGAVFTTFLTEAGASRAFAMPLGARRQPIAGKVFSFTMGGLAKVGAVGGVLVVVPLYGATANGVNLGQSKAQAYSGSSTAMPWRLKGEIIFQEVDFEPGASLVVCTGSFAMGSLVAVFGSSAPIRVDASSIAAVASGALNFAISFAPSTLNVSAPVINTTYALLRGI